jgi:chlorophyllide a reductase subunit X
MTQDGLLGLFSSASTGRDVVLEPASLFDMCGREDLSKPSLEVVYEAV